MIHHINAVPTQKRGFTMPKSPTLLRYRHSDSEQPEYSINPWRNPVVGWKENSDGVGGIHNPMGFAMTRIVHRDDENNPLYDQILLIENAGAIILPRAGNRIGLIKAWRPTGERLLEMGAEYVRQLQEQNRWEELVESLGQWQWEAPRGLAPSSLDGEDMEAYVLRTAKLEAAEEAGFELVNARIVGRVNPNSTFFAHPQYVVSADVDCIGENQPEDLEVIGGVQFFDVAELRELNSKGEFVCGLTLSAMALSGISL